MEYKDYYKILGVDKNASKDEIQRGYRKLARKFHPDVNKSADAQARFVEINEAYQVLKDPEKRSHYDQYGKYWSDGSHRAPGWGEAAAGRGGEGFSKGFQFGGGDFSFRGGDFSDFFKDLFGGFEGRAQQNPFGGKHDPKYDFQYGQQGRTSESELTVSLDDVFNGATKTISFQTWEGGVGTNMRPSQRTLQVKIPRGITNGSVIRLAGQGEKGTAGMPSGDLLLTVKIAPNPLFKVAERDLYTTVDIAPWEAALGGKIKVKTVGGEVNLNIPPGTQSGRRFRLRGKGIPGKSGGAGDIFVTTQIRIPHPLSDEERKLFENLAEKASFNPRSKGGQKAGEGQEI